MGFEIRSPESEEEFKRYYNLRWKLLRAPWDQAPGSEKDALEDRSLHLMALDHDRSPVGIARLHFNSPTEAQIRYMAVEPDYRGKGVATRLLEQLENHARTGGATVIVLHAREASVAFYEKSGYTVIAPSHTLFGCIRHFEMQKTLKKFRSL